jgi:hypothetical protein
VGAVAGAGRGQRLAAAGALGGEAGAALGAELPVGGGLGLAVSALLEELVEGVEALEEALLEGLVGGLLGPAWLGHGTYRADPGGSWWRAAPTLIVDGGRRVRQLFDCCCLEKYFFSGIWKGTFWLIDRSGRAHGVRCAHTCIKAQRGRNSKGKVALGAYATRAWLRSRG